MKLINDSYKNIVVGCPTYILKHKSKSLKINLRH